jgi:hypothetical protein
MIMLRRLLAGIIGLAVAALAQPASAFVAEVATSIPAAAGDDDAKLQEAVFAAIKDVLKQAVAFTPSLVQLQGAKLLGDRIYLLLLVADPDGEETLKAIEAVEPTSTD